MLFIALHFNSFCYLFVDVVGKVARNNSCVTNKLFSWFYTVKALKHLQVWVLTDTLASGDWLTQIALRIPPGRRFSHDSMNFCMDPFCAALHLMQSRHNEKMQTLCSDWLWWRNQNQKMNMNIIFVQLAGSRFCFWHHLWCLHLRNFSRMVFYFCHSLCCFPSQPLPLPCHRPQLVGLIAQGCPRSAGWSVRYWLLVFLKVVPAEVPWRADIPDAGTSLCEPSTSPEEAYTIDACETCCCWTCVSMQKCKQWNYFQVFFAQNRLLRTQRTVQCHDAGCS